MYSLSLKEIRKIAKAIECKVNGVEKRNRSY